MIWREQTRNIRVIFALAVSAFLLLLSAPNSANAAGTVYFYDKSMSSESFDMKHTRDGDNFELTGTMRACESFTTGCYERGNSFNITLVMEKDSSSTSSVDIWNIVKVRFKENVNDNPDTGHGFLEILNGGQVDFGSLREGDGLRVYDASSNNVIYTIDYSKPSNLSDYQAYVYTSQDRLINGDPEFTIVKDSRGNNFRKGNPIADLSALMYGESIRLYGSSYFLGDNSLFPKTLDEYIEMFTKCVEGGENKNILNNVEIKDNGDFSPSLFIGKQILKDCKYQAFPEVNLTLSAYDKWENGQRQGLVEFATSNVIISPLGWAWGGIADYFTDARNSVRFVFISNTQPLIAVVDDEGDLEIFAYDAESKELESVAGHLSPIWKADIHARSGFYNVIASKVFMPPGCKTPVPYPSDNGKVYSDSNKIEDPVGCLYELSNGWLVKWGVDNVTPGGDCDIAWIVSGDTILTDPPEIIARFGINTENLNALSRASICMYDWIVDPIVDWATGIIRYASGIAYNFKPYFVHA